MTRTLLGAIAIVVALAVPSSVLAHTGHAHKIMGTVSSIDGAHLMVKTTDGQNRDGDARCKDQDHAGEGGRSLPPH